MIGEHLSWSQAALLVLLTPVAVFLLYVVGVLWFWARRRPRYRVMKEPCRTTRRNGTQAVP